MRMEAVLAAGQIPQMNSIKVVALASEREMDRSIEYAFTQAVHHLKPHWEEAFAEGRLVFRKSSQVAAVLSRAGSRNALGRLRKVADSGDLSLKERRGAMLSLLALGGPREFRDYGLDRAAFAPRGQYDSETHANLLSRLVEEAMQRTVKPEGDLPDLLLPLLDSGHEEVTRQALVLAGLWSVGELGPKLAGKARDKGLSLALRSASFLSLAQMKSSKAPEILARFSDGETFPSPVSAIRAMCLTDFRSGRAGRFPNRGGRAQPRQCPYSLRAFLSMPLGERSLVEASVLQSGSCISPRTLQAPTLGSLSNDLDELLSLLPTQVVKLFPQIMGISMNWSTWRGRKGTQPWQNAGQLLHGLSPHRDRRGVVGPDLSFIGTTLNADRIVEELLWPARQIKKAIPFSRSPPSRGKSCRVTNEMAGGSSRLSPACRGNPRYPAEGSGGLGQETGQRHAFQLDRGHVPPATS